MQLDIHIHAIQADLAATAGLGEEASEIGAQLETGRVEVRLAGREPELVVVQEDAADGIQVAPGEEYAGRITLRLPETIKAAIEAAAAQEGISTNAWLVKTVAHSLHARSSNHSR